jgi:hypothetical protein
VILGQILV